METPKVCVVRELIKALNDFLLTTSLYSYMDRQKKSGCINRKTLKNV